MQYFCTLFDSNYMSRGLVMYESLQSHCKDFHLYIFAFDDISCEILKKENREKVTVIALKEFEDEELLRIKPLRSKGEYCWTCTSSVIAYCLSKFNLPMCTYLDADLCFYGDPTALIEELGKDSVLITDHRFSEEYGFARMNGIYCVQFISFRNDERGKKALLWWRDRCIEWCYNRFEDGKFGDQKYLDDWTQRFEGVHVLEHPGGGLAPWNVQRFRIDKKSGEYWVSDGAKPASPLIFYHFHWVKFLNDDRVDLGSYRLHFPYVLEIYKAWLQKIMAMDRILANQHSFHLSPGKLPWFEALRQQYRNLKRRFRNQFNVMNLKTFMIRGQAN